MPNELLEKYAAGAPDFLSELHADESSGKISKPTKKTQSLKRTRLSVNERYAAFVQRQKAKSLFRKYVWIKLPKDKLRKFAKWITAQDPEALLRLVERGSVNDLKCLWDQREAFEEYARDVISAEKDKKVDSQDKKV